MWIWGLEILLLSAFAQNSPLPTNVWSRISVPNKGRTSSIGFYSNGCISGAQPLPLDGTGYQVLRVTRNRYYGNPETIQFVQNLAKEVDANGSALLIGDMGQPRGGPLPYGHASHQIGLDVDVLFWTHPEQRARKLTTKERDELPFVNMLKDDGSVDTTKFTKESILKLNFATQDERVERIFVNPAIKAYLCQTLPKAELPWLHKLRPWPGHNEHFHVRLKCPAASPAHSKDDASPSECTPQDPVAPGDGCAEAIEVYKNGKLNQVETTKNHTEPEMPAHCEKVLKE